MTKATALVPNQRWMDINEAETTSNWLHVFRTAMTAEETVVSKLSFSNFTAPTGVPWQELIQSRRQNQWTAVQFSRCHLSFVQSALTHFLRLPVERVHVFFAPPTSNLTHLPPPPPPLATAATLTEDIQESNLVVLYHEMGLVMAVGLREASRLVHFQCSHCQWTVESIRGLAQGLQSTVSLLYLDLTYCRFDNNYYDQDHGHSDMVMILAEEGIARNQTLQSLGLNKCGLTSAQIATLLHNGIQDHITLRQVLFGGNALQQTYQAMVAACHVLQSPGCQLQVLGLSHPTAAATGMGNHHPHMEDSMIESDNSQMFHSLLWPALSVNRSLRTLHLASNRLEDADIPLLVRALVDHSCLEHLDLKSNHLGNSAAVHLARNLSRLPHLKRLWLLGNVNLGKAGARAFWEALQSPLCCWLQDLRLPTYRQFGRVPELAERQAQCEYYLHLNQGGRRVLLAPWDIPSSLWAVLLARVNRLFDDVSGRGNRSWTSAGVRAEVLYVLLRNGPVLLEQR